MGEFSLIPTGYSEEIRFRRDLVWFGHIYIMLIALSFLLYFTLNLETNKHIQNLKNLTDIQFSNEVLNAKIEALQDREDNLRQQHELLKSVNRGLSLPSLLKQFDNALNEHIEFSLFEFERSLNEGESKNVAIVRVVGVASSHASMAEFMGKLSEQTSVLNVELNRSQADQRQSNQIKFELAIIAGTQEIKK